MLIVNSNGLHGPTIGAIKRCWESGRGKKATLLMEELGATLENELTDKIFSLNFHLLDCTVIVAVSC